MKQLKDIFFTGNITDWSQITNGSKKGKININNTNPKKVGTPAVFNKKVTDDENTAYVNGTTIFDSLELMDDAILNDENSIGVKQLAGINSQIKVLKVNSEYPTNKAVTEATYPLGRQVFLITKGNPEGKIKDFINFILSEKGQKIAEKEGFIPLI